MGEPEAAVLDGVAGLETVEVELSVTRRRVTRSPSAAATASTSTSSEDGRDDATDPEEKDGHDASDFRGLLRSMQRQLEFLHGMTRTIAREEKASSPHSVTLQKEAPKEDAKQLLDMDAGPRKVAEYEEEPEAEDLAPSEETRALRVEVERLREQLAAARQANARLESTVQRLQSGLSEAQSSETDAPGATGACQRIDDSGEASSGATALHIEPQRAADELMRRGNVFADWKPSVVLRGHERCQEKAHELCEAVRTLALYVQTYSLERSSLVAQRDDAIREAELAWAHNAALAGSRNPQQRIKYLQQLKSDNNALRKKVRELQAMLVDRSAPGSSSADLSNHLQELPLAIETANQETQPCHERRHNELLRRLWSRREQLSAHLEQLELERGQRSDSASASASGSPHSAEKPRAEAMTSAPTSPRSLR